jgi:uncharacterized protein YlxW (UPF0749 family)
MTQHGTGHDRRQFTPDFLTELFQNPLDPGYADAAARRARDGAPTGTPKRITTGVLALTLVALGFLLVVAYRQTVADEPGRSQARSALVGQVQRRQTSTDVLQSRAEALRSDVSDLRQRELGGPAIARLRDLEAATGLARVRGDGAQLTVGDGNSPINPVTGLRDTGGRVQDLDLQLAANAFWAAGAEAISINGQRLTATSTIRQAGEAILVDFRPVTTPYDVVAVGPDDMVDDFREGYAGQWFKQLATRYGMSYEIRGVDAVTLAAATEPKLRFASPVPPPNLSASASGGPDTGAQSSAVQPTAPVTTSSGAAPTAGPPSTPSEGG